MTFAGSALIASKYALAQADVAELAVSGCLRGYPGEVPQAWVKYLANDIRIFQCESIEREQIQAASIRDVGNPKKKAIAFANFLEFQAVYRFVGSHFEIDPSIPSDIGMLYQWGASQLHDFGKEQSECLAHIATELARWCSEKGHSRVDIVESPLGGTIPAEVIAGVLQSKNVQVEIHQFLSPRLDKHGKKFSIREAAECFCKSLPLGQNPVIFPDEIMSGTRFTKLFGALQKHLGARLVPIGLAVSDWKSVHSDGVRLSKLKKTLQALPCAAQGAPVYTEFPVSALIKIDDQEPITTSTSFFWADMDICAGKRKVNLVFGLIDIFRHIFEDLVSKGGKSFSLLLALWETSTDGEVFIGTEKYLRPLILGFANKVDWEKVVERARVTFPSEYTGAQPPRTDEDVQARLKWVLNAIKEQLIPHCHLQNCEDREAWVVVNALRDLFSVIDNRYRPSLPRDRDFCEATIPYSHPIGAFHEELLRLVIADAHV